MVPKVSSHFRRGKNEKPNRQQQTNTVYIKYDFNIEALCCSQDAVKATGQGLDSRQPSKNIWHFMVYVHACSWIKLPIK